MDRVVIERKLESLRRCLTRVRSKRPATVAELVADVDLQDVLVLNLSRAVQLCVDIGAHLMSESGQLAPVTMGETFTRMADAKLLDADLALRLRKSVGFRNIAVHNYEAIDWAIVHAVSDVSVTDFEDFARSVLASLKETPGRPKFS